MQTEKRNDPCFYVWIDEERRIVSFHEADGFQKIPFASRESLLAFVIEKGYSGYRIQ